MAALVRGSQCRCRAGLGFRRGGANRQGHVGEAGRDGRDGEGEDRPSTGRRLLCLGTVAHGGDASRHALPPGGRRRPADRHLAPVREPRNPPRSPSPDRGPEHRRDRGRAGQQRAEHPRVRGPLDRRGRRLFEGARYPQRGADGRPGHLAHLQSAHRQLAAPRAGQPRSGGVDLREDGGGRRRAELE